MAARTPWANPEDTWRIYSALAAEAGVSRPVRVDDPRVLVGRISSGGSETALFVNCSPDEVSTTPLRGSGVELDLAEGRLTLEPFGVALVSAGGVTTADGTRSVSQAAAVAGTGEGRDARA
jgi:hypothetical protein